MAVDDATVKRFVQRALDHHNGYGDVSTRLDNSWKEVNTQREAPNGVNCGNYDLTAADHYLFMRWAGSELGPAFQTFLSAAASTYDGIYKGGQEIFDYIFGGDVVFKTGQCKATGFSIGVIMWGQQGVRDGVVDFFRSDSAKLNSPTHPIPVISNFW